MIARMILTATLILAWTIPAFAVLEEVRVGGEITLRNRNFFNYFRPSDRETLSFPYTAPLKRALGPLGLSSRYDFDQVRDKCYAETYSKLKVEAIFSQGLRSVLCIDASRRWGEDFRSDYVSGLDQRSVGETGDPEFLEAYLAVDEFFGTPIQIQAGRQGLIFGKGWLVGERISASSSVTFDALRLSYSGEKWTVDGWGAKLSENYDSWGEGDVDFYGLYSVYRAWEAATLEAYWFWVRDHSDLEEHTQQGFLGERIEDLLDLDSYDNSNLHTLGLRLHGATGSFSYDGELAYQWGEANAVGHGFRLYEGGPGDTEAKYNHWAGDIEFRYQSTLPWALEPYIGGAYFEGNDKRDISFLEWLNPFHRPEASVSFNRLFSTVNYSPMHEGPVNYSNFWQLRTGLRCTPSPAIKAQVEAYHLEVVDSFNLPWYATLGNTRLTVIPPLSFLTVKSSEDLGWGLLFKISYAYSADLTFKVVYEHLFTGKGFYDGSYLRSNGLEMVSGTDDVDVDYYYLLAVVKF